MSRENSDRFLEIYNEVDKYLENLDDSKNRESYNSKITKLSESNKLVRHHQRELKKFGELRNAIVHNSSTKRAIAEPHMEIVDEFEIILNKLKEPKKIEASKLIKKVYCTSPDCSIGNTLKTMGENFYSQVPVYDKSGLVDILSNNTISRWLAYHLDNQLVDLKDTLVKEVLKHMENKNNYLLMRRKSLLIDISDAFNEHRDRGKYLDAIIITHNGIKTEKPLGIVTVEDLPEIHAELNK